MVFFLRDRGPAPPGVLPTGRVGIGAADAEVGGAPAAPVLPLPLTGGDAAPDPNDARRMPPAGDVTTIAEGCGESDGLAVVI